jgi:hypothetical protein
MESAHAGIAITLPRKGKVQFPRLLSPAQRKPRVFPRLFYLTFAKLHGWDVRDGMVVTLSEIAALCGLLLCLFRRTAGATFVSVRCFCGCATPCRSVRVLAVLANQERIAMISVKQ